MKPPKPMLAHSYSKHGSKITFPCIAQPKLDGIRCIAVKKGNKVTLWTRNGKRITSCPHIERDLAVKLGGYDFIFDGELYNHTLKDEFETIVSAVRRQKPSEEALKIQYHVYDIIDKKTILVDRLSALPFFSYFLGENIRIVQHKYIKEENITSEFNLYLKEGYEGMMLRNANSLYVNKRSFNLQKVKEFDDAEFPIVGVIEGKGKLKGLLGAFTCVNDKGIAFEVKLKGNHLESKKYLMNESTWKNKLLTVQYQGITGKNKVPRFPVGLRIKEEI